MTTFTTPTSVSNQLALQNQKNVQHILLSQLKNLNAELKELHPKVKFEREAKRAGQATHTDYAAIFRITKDRQLQVLVDLKKTNAKLKELRPLVKNEKQSSRAPSEKSIERQAQEKIKAAERAENKFFKQLEKDKKKVEKEAARALAKEQREARREARAIELEEKQLPSRGYNFPLLTDAEREGTNFLMKNVFSSIKGI